MAKSSRFILPLLGLALVVGYTNCQPSSVKFRTAGSFSRTSNNGNGEPYVGKPDPGEYYRQIPGFKCGGQDRVFENLSVTETQATLKSINQSNCGVISTEVPLENIAARKYNPDWAAYNDGAFERLESPPVPGADAGVAEVFCKSMDYGTSTMDIVIRQVPGEALNAKIYSPQGVFENLGLSKIQGLGVAEYRSPEVDLTVNSATHTGRLLVKLGALNFAAEATCMGAGWYDVESPVVPSFSLNFSSPELPPSVTFSRSTTASYVDAGGVVRTASANQPRFEFKSDGTVKGLLIEPAATNLLIYSDHLENAAYFYQQTTGQYDVAQAPDGTSTADAIIEGTGSVTPLVSQNATGDLALPHACSAYVKDNGRHKAIVKVEKGINDFCQYEVNLAAQSGSVVAKGSGSFCQGFLQTLANGWYRIAVSGIPDVTGGTARIDCSIFPSGAPDGAPLVPYTGDGVSGLFVWGFQLEQGSLPTSYMATAGSRVTRSADAAVVSTSGWYNGNSGSLLASGEKKFVPTAVATRQSIYSFAGSSGFSLGYDSLANLMSLRLPSSQIDSSVSLSQDGSHKILFRYGSGAPSLIVDGTLTSGSVTPALNSTTLNLGGAANESWNGYVKSIIYWPQALPDSTAVEIAQ